MTTRNVYLFPSEILVDSKPHKITTVLGTCVSVCIWDRELHFGGINHFLLPKNPVGEPFSLKYGDYSTEQLIKQMIQLGSKIAHLDSKIIGGAEGINILNSAFGIGERNAESAMQVIKSYKIKISSVNIGGFHPRKIIFNTHTGELFMKLIKRTVSKPVGLK